jgi:hypothetical protein
VWLQSQCWKEDIAFAEHKLEITDNRIILRIAVVNLRGIVRELLATEM